MSSAVASQRSRVLSLYREMIRFSQAIPDKWQSRMAVREARKWFVEHREEKDDERIEELIKTGLGRLSVLKVRVPAHAIPIRVRFKDPEKDAKHRSSYDEMSNVTSYIVTKDGKIQEGFAEAIETAPYSTWRDGNLDPDMIRKHEIQMERFHFKGPYWEKRRRGWDPFKDLWDPKKEKNFFEELAKGNLDIEADLRAAEKGMSEMTGKFRPMGRSDFDGQDETISLIPSTDKEKLLADNPDYMNKELWNVDFAIEDMAREKRAKEEAEKEREKSKIRFSDDTMYSGKPGV